MRLSKRPVTFICARLDPAAIRQVEAVRALLLHQGATIFHDDDITLYAAFSLSLPAVTTMIAAQRLLQANGAALAVAIHSGLAQEHQGIYAGKAFNRTVSILDALHAGQIVVSRTVSDDIARQKHVEISLLNLGEYRLRDLLPTIQLFQVVVEGLPSDFAVLNSLDIHQHNLPIHLTPLIGRAQEVDSLCSVLRAPSTRLLTLVGASGTGKTRLALQVAVELITEFADGVFIVPLAPVTDPALLLSVIAQELNIKEQSTQPLLATMATELAGKRMLLVLDNFEQIMQAAPAIADLFNASSQLKVLVTSQIHTALPDEQVFSLPPLAVPAQIESLPLDSLAAIPAVAFFVERARDVQPSFVLNESNAAAVVELCRRLKGLPLAIELVAAQSKRYFPQDMLVLLENHLVVARATMRINTREDILQPVLNWICGVLGAPLAAFFARLGVFEGGCTAESAAAICNPANELGLEAADALHILLDNHLLLREELKETQVRYTMLDAVHEYAHKRLTKPREMPRFRRLHAEYYTALAEEAEPFLMGANQREWLARLRRTNHNLRAALVWSEASAPALLVRLSAALHRFWIASSHFREGRHWLETALKHRESATPNVQSTLLHGLGLMTMIAGDYATAQRHLEESLAIRRTLDGEELAVIGVLNSLGATTIRSHQTALATGYYREALAIARSIGNQNSQSLLLGNLGVLYYYEADFAQARDFFEQALTLDNQQADLLGYCIRLNNLGLACYQSGDSAQAEQLFHDSLAISRDLPSLVMQADTLGNLAKVAVDNGDVAAARAMLVEATAIREADGDRYTIAMTLEGWAKLALAEGQPGRAVRLIALSHALLGDVTETIMPLALLERERIERAARPLLSAEAYQASLVGIGPQIPLDVVFAAMLEV